MSSPDDLVGSWSYQEDPIAEGMNEILDSDEAKRITIVKGANCPNSFDVTVPLKSDDPMELMCLPPILDGLGRLTLSGIDTTKGIGIRLVFDLSVNPPEIFHGLLGSTVERWSGPLPQPNDMGTITGTKG